VRSGQPSKEASVEPYSRLQELLSTSVEKKDVSMGKAAGFSALFEGEKRESKRDKSYFQS